MENVVHNNLVKAMAFLLLCSVVTIANAADIFISTPAFNPDPGQQFEVEVTVDVGPDVLGNYFFNLNYDSVVLNIVSINGGATPEFSALPFTDVSTFAAGVTPITFAQGNMSSPTGFVSVARILFQAVGLAGEISPIDIEVIALGASNAASLPSTVFPTSVQLFFNAADDTDGDGLTDLAEANAGTNINLADTDGDGLEDGFEVLNGLDALDNGSNDPLQGASGDPDGDTLTNAQEQTLGTNPARSDSDNDGLRDDLEVSLGTDPTSEDSDGDLLLDAFEVNGLLDPLDNGSIDFDSGANADPDADGLTNLQEQTAGTLPREPDTDGDALPDGFEVNNSLDPLDNGSINASQGANGDPDLDGYTNLKEFQIGSHPQDDHSQPVDIQLQLSVGMQPLSYPLNLPVDFSAFDLLAQLNSSGNVVESIQTISATNTQTAQWNAGSPSGNDFALTPGQGVLGKVSTNANIVFQDAVTCPAIDLVAGLNIVGFQCVPQNYTAVQLYFGLGADLLVSSIQRFNLLSGRYETITTQNGFVTGTDFPIRVGDAYLVHMKAAFPGFDPLQ